MLGFLYIENLFLTIIAILKRFDLWRAKLSKYDLFQVKNDDKTLIEASWHEDELVLRELKRKVKGV